MRSVLEGGKDDEDALNGAGGGLFPLRSGSRRLGKLAPLHNSGDAPGGATTDAHRTGAPWLQPARSNSGLKHTDSLAALMGAR